MFDREKLGFFRRYWLTIDKKLFFSFLMLICMGLLFIFTASMPVANRIGASTNYFFIKKQLFYIFISIFAFSFITLFSDYFNIKVISLCFCVLIIMLLFVLIGGFAVKGAKRWIYIGGISLQPSEIIKPFLIIINAFILSYLKDKNDFLKIIISLIPFGIVCFLILCQPDIGMLMLLIAIYITQIFLSNIKFKTLFCCGLSTIVLAFLCYFALPHVRSRINNYVASLQNKEQMNYQVFTSIKGYNNAGIMGQGFLEGKVKAVIPDCHTDFIFPVITEEFGFIFSAFIIIFYLYIATRVILIGYYTKDDFIAFSLYGLALLFIVQTFINIGVTLNLLPTKGMTLPFLSYGGSSLIGSSITFAFIIKYTKQKNNYDNFEGLVE